MKVGQEKAGFAPITITLETQEEADIMWAMFNAPTGDVVRNSMGHITADKLGQSAYDMFCAFDDIYHFEC